MPRPGAGTSNAATALIPSDPAEQAAVLALLGEADPTLGELIATFGPPAEVLERRGRVPTDAYGALLRAIVGQQLSTKAARTIFGRLTDLFGGRTPSPEELLEADPGALRGVGLSGAKASYLRDLAARIMADELDLDQIGGLSDDEVLERLTAVKGLGTWTVQMFMMFHLGRGDVLPVGDLGIRRAAMLTYGLEELPDAETLERLGERWRPHRSIASLYLWRSLDTE